MLEKRLPFRRDSQNDTIEYATQRIDIFYNVLKTVLGMSGVKKINILNSDTGMYLFLPILKDLLPKFYSKIEYDKIELFKSNLENLFSKSVRPFVRAMGSEVVKDFKNKSFGNPVKNQVAIIKEIQKVDGYKSDLIAKYELKDLEKIVKKGRQSLF